MKGFYLTGGKHFPSVCKERCSQICKEQAMFFLCNLVVPCQAEYLLGIMSCGRLLMVCKA
jgi:hypothetical protein